MDSIHKFGSRWFCLQMLGALNQVRALLSDLESLDAPALKPLLPLIFGMRTTSHAISLLRNDGLLNEAHVLTRLLTERVISFCYRVVEPSDEESLKDTSSLPKDKKMPISLEEVTKLASRFSEPAYDSKNLEQKLEVLKARTQVNVDFLRLTIATNFPQASAAMQGSPFGAICHMLREHKECERDFFQQEFAVLFFTCACLIHQTFAAVESVSPQNGLLEKSQAVLKTPTELMKRANESATSGVEDVEGWWDTLADFEHSALSTLTGGLSPYNEAFKICTEAGVDVPTLPHSKQGANSLRVSALFLKRTLNDLRALWLLVARGYTSQSASIGASLFENALAVECIAGNEARASQFQTSDSGELPWSKADMCRMQTADARARGDTLSEPQERSWKFLYGQYSWLCEIKHPTLRQSIYDAGSTAIGNSGFSILTLPDTRVEDLGVKQFICMLALTGASRAITAFARGADVDKGSPYYERFALRLKRLDEIIEEQIKDKTALRVPYGIPDTAWGQKHLRPLIRNGTT